MLKICAPTVVICCYAGKDPVSGGDTKASEGADSLIAIYLEKEE